MRGSVHDLPVSVLKRYTVGTTEFCLVCYSGGKVRLVQQHLQRYCWVKDGYGKYHRIGFRSRTRSDLANPTLENLKSTTAADGSLWFSAVPVLKTLGFVPPKCLSVDALISLKTILEQGWDQQEYPNMSLVLRVIAESTCKGC